MAIEDSNLNVGIKFRQDDNSLRETKAAIKGLALEFPELARVANLALNPISGAIAAIIGSLAIWKQRQEQLKKALQETELPDLVVQTTKYREEIEKIATAQKTLAQASQQRVTALQTELELHKQLIQANVGAGLLTSQEGAEGISAAELAAGQAGINARMGAANELAASSAAKRARAGGMVIMSEKNENALADKLKAAADAAAAEIKERQGTIGELREFESGEGSIGNRLKWAAIIAKGGMESMITGKPAMDTGDYIANEYSRIRSLQANVDRYNAFESTRGSRAEARALRSRLLDEAQSEGAEATNYLYGQMPGEVAGQRRSEGQAPYVNLLGQLGTARKELDDDLKRFQEMNKGINALITANRGISKENLAALEAAAKEIEADKKKIATITQQLANQRAP